MNEDRVEAAAAACRVKDVPPSRVDDPRRADLARLKGQVAIYLPQLELVERYKQQITERERELLELNNRRQQLQGDAYRTLCEAQQVGIA